MSFYILMVLFYTGISPAVRDYASTILLLIIRDTIPVYGEDLPRARQPDNACLGHDWQPWVPTKRLTLWIFKCSSLAKSVVDICRYWRPPRQDSKPSLNHIKIMAHYLQLLAWYSPVSINPLNANSDGFYSIKCLPFPRVYTKPIKEPG